MPTIENLCTFILNSIKKVMAGMVSVLGSFILEELFSGGNDGVGLRLSGIALMILCIFLFNHKWIKKDYKYELSCIGSNFSLSSLETIEFTKLTILAASEYICTAFSHIKLLVVQFVNSIVLTSIKTVSSSYSAAKACLKSALGTIALTLTPKLLLIPSTRRA